jgi:hypothetical protein
MDLRRTTGRDLRPRIDQTGSRRQRARLGPLGRRRAVRSGPQIAAGQDLSAPVIRRGRRSLSRSAWLAIVGGGLGAALVLVQLRTESIDLRYRLARSLQSEQQLLEDQRRLTVALRQLRHPVRLAGLGESLGLARPEAVAPPAPAKASAGHAP